MCDHGQPNISNDPPEIPNKHELDGESSLQYIYLFLKETFEGISMVSGELSSITTTMDKEQIVQLNETKQPLVTMLETTYALSTTLDAVATPSISSCEDISAIVKR